jgi:hypothetical protein
MIQLITRHVRADTIIRTIFLICLFILSVATTHPLDGTLRRLEDNDPGLISARFWNFGTQMDKPAQWRANEQEALKKRTV